MSAEKFPEAKEIFPQKEMTPEEMFRMERKDPGKVRELIDLGYAHYAKIVREQRIDIESEAFRAKITPEKQWEVKKDSEVMRKLAAKYEKEKFDPKAKGRGPLPLIAEGMVASDFYEAGWFGEPEEEIYITLASKYDDLFNKSDLIFELVPREQDKGAESSFIAAIDVTTIDEAGWRLATKYDTLRGLIRDRGLGGFKYYLAPRSKELVSKEEGVPHVVLALSRKDIIDILVLYKLWDENYRNPEISEYCRRALESHKNNIRAQIYQVLLRSYAYARKYKESFKKDDQLDRMKKQEDNMRILEAALGRLKELGYPSEISDEQVRAHLDAYLPMPGVSAKNLQK